MKTNPCPGPTGAKIRLLLLTGALFLTVSSAIAQRQMERLDRGVVVVRTGAASVYVGWRMLGTDPDDVGFNLYRVPNGGAPVKVNSAVIANSCNYVDTGATLTQSNAWFVRPVTNGVEWADSAAFGLPANAPTQQYLSVPLQIPPAGTNASGAYTYRANDCSVGDLDGDGQYEIVVKWDPTDSKDNSQSGYTGDVYLDAYKLDGTRMWRIDLGKNIRAGAHYTQFMVYDLDGDGKAEIACKTAPGTVDGQGQNVIMPGDNPNADYRNASGYILSGPEYLTIFDGATGKNLWTTNYIPPRGTVSSWGDSYGNRVDRFLACVAYLDGVRPSLVMCRGYYTRTVLAAWDWRNGKLTQRWVFDSNNPGCSGYAGQGNHNLSVGDVDGDGKDEIVYGACAIDDNGQGLYTTGLGHGDAMHLSDMDPDRPGLEVWDVHETPNPVSGGGEFRDARTGQLIWGYPGTGDTGRGLAAHIDPSHPGYQMWSSATDGTYDDDGVKISSSKPSVNFAIWWNASLSRDLLDGSNNDGGSTGAPHIDRWTGSGTTRELSASGCYVNNSTKANPCLTADILGDWREEAIFRTADSSALRIYISTIVATNRFCTFMHDPQYRLAIAWQNTAYNQPPHTGFYIGETMWPPPRAPISDANAAWRGGNGGNIWDDLTTSNWFFNGVWTNNNLTTFAQGDSVLFDMRGATNPTVNLSGTLAPSKVTVFTPVSYTFAGSGSLTGAMTLYKTGPGRLTLANTNTYTGATFVSAGSLFVNGALPGSAVTVERRGTPEGPAQIGGSGCLGQGLTVQTGCSLVVSPGTNAAGTLTISNHLTELGRVQNLFDLTSDQTGGAKTNDCVKVVGNLVLTGTNTIAINQPDGWLGNGVYPLFQYSGSLTGGLTNLVLSGNFVQTVALTNPPGMIGLLAIVPGGPPEAPGGLTATAVSPQQILLSWTDNSTNETTFVIERSLNNVSFTSIASVDVDVTSYLNSGLAPNTTYYYRVSGTNMVGASDYSNTANAKTPATPFPLTWRGDGTLNSWDEIVTPNWQNGTNAAFFADGAFVTFDDSGSNNPVINLATNLQPGSVTVAGAKNYTFGGDGALTGGMTLFKSGSGTLTLAAANSFSGGVKVAAGTVALSNTSGAGSGPLIFNGGTVSFILGSQQYYANPLNVTGPGTILSAGGNNNVVTGPWSGTNTLNITMTGGTFTVGGDMSGFSGTVALGSSAGTFRFYGSSGSANPAFDLGNGTVTLNNRNGVTVTLGALTGGSGTFLSGAGAVNAPSTYTIGGKNLDTTFAGTIMDANSSRTTSIVKEGTGNWTLTGANTYSGGTTINDGTLLAGNASGSATGTGAVTVNSGGALGGSGAVGGAVTVNSGGKLSPGASVGTLTLNQDLTLDTNADLDFDLGATNTSDRVAVAGALTLGGTLNVTNRPGFGADAYTLFTYGGALSGSLPAIGAMPPGYTGSVDTNTPGQVKLVVQAVPSHPPLFSDATVADGKLAFNVSGGTTNGTFYVLASTNLALPREQWQFIATNRFDAGGNFTATNLLSTNAPQSFYLLQLP